MTIDGYAPCPCGSGKKLKFCKCIDQPQDLEKIVKLIEGGQEIAALDRINQLLAKTPSAAWLLAMKGELALQLQELDTFRETANRFLKLKPDNPLALVMHAIVAVLTGEPAEVAAKHLLEGMAESRESLPSLTPMAIQLLVRHLIDSQRGEMMGFWTDLILNMNLGELDASFRSMIRSVPLNLIVKVPPKVIEDPAGSAWQERLAEVLSLSRTFRFPQVETKLRSILRDYPDQPGPLSHLLRAQYALLDQHGALATAKKLANSNLISEDDRAYYLAFSLEIEPEQKQLQIPVLVKYYEVDAIDRVQQALEQTHLVTRSDNESSEQPKHFFAALVNDEVPAKEVFALQDRPTTDASSDPDAVTSYVGVVALLGRQTDKPARALLMARDLAENRALIDLVTGVIQPQQELADHQVPNTISYSEHLRRPRTLLGKPHQPLSIERVGQCMADEFLKLPFKCLDSKTPLEAASDEPRRATLRGLLFHLEGEQDLVMEPGVIDSIYERLQLQRPKLPLSVEDEAIRLRSVLDLDRLDATSMSDSQLRGVLSHAHALHANRAAYQMSKEVLARSIDDLGTRLNALSVMLGLVPELEAKIEISGQLEEALAKSNMPLGRLVIERVTLFQMAGREEEGQKYLLEACQKYPSDPYLLSFIQYMMQERQRQATAVDPLGSRLLQSESAAPESGLVLPGQGPSAGGEKSKLWLPGS